MSYELSKLETLPKKPGVYLMKNEKGEVLYIGKAKILEVRVKQYFKEGSDTRAMIPFLLEQLSEIETMVTFTEKEALLLENNLIKKHQPKYNILLKDDKTFISLMINNKHEWPMLKLVRHLGKTKKDGLYFGPYTSALAARQTFDVMTKTFPLRQCSDRELFSRKRPCLLYSIKRCVAPCVRKCTKEEYDKILENAIDFLKGKNQKIIQSLREEMERASENLQFERAASILRTIEQIQEVTHKTKPTVYANITHADVFNFFKRDRYIILVKLLFHEGRLIAFEHFDFALTAQTDEEALTSFFLQHYAKETPAKEILVPLPLPDADILEEILNVKITVPQKGEKKHLLDLAFENAKTLYEQERNNPETTEDLLVHAEETFKLSRLPSRIECFDTSHISGTDTVASMVAFTDGIKDPKRYRLYKIRNEEHGDDYRALEEVLSRRLQRAKEEDDLPNLIIVDGGKGQLSVAMKVIHLLNIATVDVIAVTKEHALHTKGLTKEKVYLVGKSDPIELDSHSSLLFFLQQIRDEAHRRAITFHRKKRGAHVTHSFLDNIPGIGPIKKRALLKSFGSIKRIKDATKEEILALKGFSEKDYENLKTAFLAH